MNDQYQACGLVEASNEPEKKGIYHACDQSPQNHGRRSTPV